MYLDFDIKLLQKADKLKSKMFSILAASMLTFQ